MIGGGVGVGVGMGVGVGVSDGVALAEVCGDGDAGRIGAVVTDEAGVADGVNSGLGLAVGCGTDCPEACNVSAGAMLANASTANSLRNVLSV
jgi:hypothetical protein